MTPARTPSTRLCRWGEGLLLLLVAAALQALLVVKAPVPALDSTRYVRMARSCRTDGLFPTLVKHEDQPLFPVLIAGAEPLVRWLHPGPQRWMRAAQAVAAVAAVAAVMVLWRLFRLLWPARIAWSAALLAALLPAVARMGADATSDPVGLLFFLAALWFGLLAAQAVQDDAVSPRPTVRKRPPCAWLFLAGASAALAWTCSRQYFVLLVLPGAVWFASGKDRLGWRALRQGALAGGGFVLGAALVLGGWLLASRPAPPFPTLRQVLGWAPRDWTVPSPVQTSRQHQRRLARSYRWRTSDGRKMAFWKKDPRHSIRTQNSGQFALRFGRQLVQAFHYLPAALALGGILSFLRTGGLGPRRLRHERLHRLAGAVWLLQLGFSFGGTWHLSYVSDRHLIPLAVLGLGWSIVGAMVVARTLSSAAGRRPARFVPLQVPAGVRRRNARASCFRIVFLAMVALCLLKWRHPPQQSQWAYRQAGLWLSRQVNRTDALLDTRGWSELFTGARTYLLANGRQALADSQLQFVVVQRRELLSPSRRGRTLREVLQRAGTLVRVFAAPEGRTDRDVLVFAWSPQRFAQHYRRRASPPAPRSPGGSLPVTSVSHKHAPRTEARSLPSPPPPATSVPKEQPGTPPGTTSFSMKPEARR